ncbi:MAG: hypothetical protein KF819_39765, partial [Labilithrix sp.]|nr:hypothetical protein [Labilithrix sp.]
ASLPRSDSIHERGSRVALWVSAIEILAHPPNANANLGTVLNLLDELTWNDARLRARRYVVRYGNNPPRRRLVGKLYRELYQARNDFLHGNDVSITRLFPFEDVALPALPRTAAFIYKAALLAFVAGVRDRRRRRAHAAQELQDLWEAGGFEECLLKAGGIEP